MVDPTSELGENENPADAPRCGTCGTPVANAPDHRVITWVEEGAVRAVHFCDDSCRAAWDG